MYLARFEGSDDEWIQATAVVEVAADSTGRGLSTWELVAGELSVAARIPDATVGCRLTLDRSRSLHQTITVTTPARHEADLRQSLARLTRIERLRQGAVSLAQARHERDDWMERVGEWRYCATTDAYSVAGIPLACDFRIATVLDELLTHACLAGETLAYQIHLRAVDVSPEWVRSARKNVLQLRDLPGVRSRLVDWQEELARGLGSASAICEEYLIVDSAEFARSVERLLADRFRAAYAPLGFPPATFSFERNAFQEPIATGIHSHDLEPLSTVGLCGLAESAAGRDRLLAWQPAARLLDLLAQTTEEPVADEAVGVDHRAADVAPAPYTGSDPAIFISYRRRDLPRVAVIIRTLQQFGMPVWYDRGIPGGSEWDDVIEAHLSNARLVVLCVSRDALESRYVRREVKFADALSLPIVPVLLEDVTPRGGLRMMLTQYQSLDSRAHDFEATLRSAVAQSAQA